MNGVTISVRLKIPDGMTAEEFTKIIESQAFKEFYGHQLLVAIEDSEQEVFIKKQNNKEISK